MSGLKLRLQISNEEFDYMRKINDAAIALNQHTSAIIRIDGKAFEVLYDSSTHHWHHREIHDVQCACTFRCEYSCVCECHSKEQSIKPVEFLGGA